jgi:hypothetical protein
MTLSMYIDGQLVLNDRKKRINEKKSLMLGKTSDFQLINIDIQYINAPTTHE